MRAALLLALFAAGLSLGAAPAHAQYRGAQQQPFGWFEQMFQPERPGQGNPGYDVERARRVPKRHVARPKPTVERQPEKPAVPPRYFVAVLGDSLGQMLGQGLAEAFTDRPEVAILRKARENTGLVRDDYFDWPKAVHDLLASNEKIDVAVMLIGSNDRQPLRIGGTTYDLRSDKWDELYKTRIEAISAAFRDKHIPLIWVGLPIMKSERLADDVLAFNDFYREQVEKAGGTYIDIWEAFGDDRGQYSPFGPDINGQSARLRAADGVHFTRAGSRKLAHFVEGDIRHRLDAAPPPADPLMVTVPTAPLADKPVAAPAPVPAVAPVTAAPAPTPVAGPVLPLTGPSLAPDGQLAGPLKPGSDKPSAVIERTLAQGRPPAPKPGRSDDFTWPEH